MDRLRIVRRRLRDQRLTGAALPTPAAVVAALVAVQAQDWAECKWAIAQRCPPGTTDADVEAALTTGAVVRTHVLRPTWHVVAAQDVRWLLRLTAGRVHAANAAHYRGHALDEGVLARAHDILRDALADGEHRTRAELGAALAAAGLPGAGNALAYVTMHAELEGLIGGGPRRGRRHTSVLLEERLRGVREHAPDDPVAALAARWLSGHGPATARDFSWWSGLTVADARGGLERAEPAPEVRRDPDGRTWYAASGPPAPARRGARALLVGMFDESVIAFQELRAVVAGQAHSSLPLERRVVVDGLTVGSWRRSVDRGGVLVEVALLRDLDPRDADALGAEVARLGRVLGLPARLEARRAA